MPQVSKIEHEERINYIIELIINGVTQRKFILQNVIKKYNICESQVDKDLKQARLDLKDILKLDTDQKKAEIEARYNHLYLKNIKIQDYRECRALLDSLVKLGGLSAPEKIETTNKYEDLTPEERDARIEELYEKREKAKKKGK